MTLKYYCAVLLCGIASTSSANPMCQPPPPKQSEICYVIGDGNPGDDCDFTSQKECVPAPAPPPPPSVSCHVDGQGYNCEVWPRATGVTYRWTSSSVWFMDPGPTSSPYQRLACTTSGPHYGVYEVTVTGPNGASSSSGTTFVYCDPSGGAASP